jgi:hypothetical protein
MAKKKSKTSKLISVIEQKEKLIEIEKQLKLEALADFGKIVLENFDSDTGRINKDAEKSIREKSIELKNIF